MPHERGQISVRVQYISQHLTVDDHRHTFVNKFPDLSAHKIMKLFVVLFAAVLAEGHGPDDCGTGFGNTIPDRWCDGTHHLVGFTDDFGVEQCYKQQMFCNETQVEYKLINNDARFSYRFFLRDDGRWHSKYNGMDHLEFFKEDEKSLIVCKIAITDDEKRGKPRLYVVSNEFCFIIANRATFD